MELRDLYGVDRRHVREPEVAYSAVPRQVVWLGHRPAWLALDAAASELAAVEVTSPHVLQRERKGTDTPIVHVAEPSAIDVRRLGRAAAVVLDLSSDGAPPSEQAAAWAALSDLVLVGSRAALRDLRERCPALAERSALFRAPVDVTEHAPLRSLLETRSAQLKAFVHARELTRPLVLFAGPFTLEGGLDLAIDAVHALRTRQPAVRFAAVRHGAIDEPYLDRCRSHALALGVFARIEPCPSADELPFWYALATVVCVPSRSAVDTKPVKLAAAAGRPVVASDLDPLAELIGNNETGFLLPVEDPDTLAAALGALIGDEQEARRLGDAARRTAELELSPAAAARRLRRLWTRALEQRRDGARRVGDRR